MLVLIIITNSSIFKCKVDNKYVNFLVVTDNFKIKILYNNDIKHDQF